MKKKALLSVFLSLLLSSTLFVTFCSAVPTHATTSWNIQTVYKSAYISNRFIAIDSINNPHIVYNYGNEDIQYLAYASWNGTGWNTQTISPWYYSLDFAIDAQNNPHILCFSYVGYSKISGLTYASWNGSNWTLELVDDQPTYVGSLAFDSSDNPQIAYITNINSEGSGTLKYANWTGSGWNTKIVDSDARNLPLSLAIDSSDNAHIMYSHTLYNINYAVSNHAAWNERTVIVNATFGNMVLDSKGYPHYIYLSNPYELNNTLKYASWNGSAWNTQTIVSNIRLEGGSYLTLDALDYPHIDYFNGTLMYTRWTGTTWDTQKVDDSSAGEAGAIAVDSYGNPYICYFGPRFSFKPFADLMYATANEPTPTPTATSAPLPTAPTPALWILLPFTVLTIAVVAALAYLWKKKTQSLS